MTVAELYTYFDTRFSASLSLPWDHDGLQICPDPGREARRVLVSLDVTREAVARAVREGCDAILTHHPLFFEPLRQLCAGVGRGETALPLIRAGIAQMSFHTRFDAADGGMNDLLCAAVGAEPAGRVGPAGEEVARLARIEPQTPRAFAQKVKKALGASFVLLTEAGEGPVGRIAVCGGDAKDFILPAAEAGAQLLLCGRAGYNADVEAPEYGVSVLEAGHYNTEAVCLPYFSEELKRLGIEPVVYGECAVRAL